LQILPGIKHVRLVPATKDIKDLQARLNGETQPFITPDKPAPLVVWKGSGEGIGLVVENSSRTSYDLKVYHNHVSQGAYSGTVGGVLVGIYSSKGELLSFGITKSDGSVKLAVPQGERQIVIRVLGGTADCKIIPP